mmetsp:Transcript_9819/g.23465  ORF Transcript_9819/g.23465 Transcript_9819/m.23465 type:complete len:171 (-) Transcript_9819:33-545(-)
MEEQETNDSHAVPRTLEEPEGEEQGAAGESCGTLPESGDVPGTEADEEHAASSPVFHVAAQSDGAAEIAEMEEEETDDSHPVPGTQEEPGTEISADGAAEIEIEICAEASQREEASEAELLLSGSFVQEAADASGLAHESGLQGQQGAVDMIPPLPRHRHGRPYCLRLVR